MTILDSIKSLFVIPPASSYLPSVRTIAPVEQKFGPFYPVNLSPLTSPAPIYGPAAAEALRRTYGGGYASNSAVMACIRVIERTYVEAPIRVFRTLPDGKIEPLTPHPVTELLARPNPGMTTDLVMAYVQYCKVVYGNAYLRKIRNGAGQVVELWPISPAVCWPVRENNSRNFIDFYAYQFKAGSGNVEKIPVEDIVHFRRGIDDRNHMLGLSPLAHLVREIDADNEATAMAARLARRNAIAGMVVTIPPEAGDIGLDAANSIKERINNTFGGEGQGDTAVLTGGATANQYGFNPQQLDLIGLHLFPESRIAAEIGVPAIMAGLNVGLQNATYSNVTELAQFLIEGTIIPAYREDDAVLNQQLLPEFTDDPALSLLHDISDMRSLQPDEDAKYTRLTLAVGGAWLTKNEARTDAGFPTVADGDEIGTPAPEPPPGQAAGVDKTGNPIPGVRSVKALNAGDFASTLLALRAAHERELTGVLRTYFSGLRLRVAARMQAEEAA